MVFLETIVPLPADIIDVSCKAGGVSASVFDRYCDNTYDSTPSTPGSGTTAPARLPVSLPRLPSADTASEIFRPRLFPSPPVAPNNTILLEVLPMTAVVSLYKTAVRACRAFWQCGYEPLFCSCRIKIDHATVG